MTSFWNLKSIFESNPKAKRFVHGNNITKKMVFLTLSSKNELDKSNSLSDNESGSGKKRCALCLFNSSFKNLTKVSDGLMKSVIMFVAFENNGVDKWCMTSESY